MIVNPHQLGKNRSQVTATRRQLEVQQFFTGMMPRDFVGQRRNIIHAVDDGHILIEVQDFPQLFKTAMQVADIRRRVDDHFAIELEHQTQSGVRGRVLRAEV